MSESWTGTPSCSIFNTELKLWLNLWVLCSPEKGKSDGQFSYPWLSTLLQLFCYKRLHLFEDCSSFKWGPDLSPFYLEINYLVVILRCVHWTDSSHKEQDRDDSCQGGTWTAEMLTSLTFHWILGSKKDGIYQDKFTFHPRCSYSAGKWF